MLATFRRWLLIFLLMIASGYLLFRGLQYRRVRYLLPEGTMVAEVDVSGLTMQEASEKVAGQYSRPVYLYHRDEHVEVVPENVGFALDLQGMFAEVEADLREQDEALRFASFVVGRPLQPVLVPLAASLDADGLRGVLHNIADLLDQPPRVAQILAEERMREGEPGYETDIEASLPEAEAAFFRLEDRSAKLVVVEEPAPEMTLDLLGEVIKGQLAAFDGVASIYVIDLQTGEELALNIDVPMSGLSILKIAIFEEAYRALDNPPDAFQQGLFLDTATKSSNYAANLLLHIVAGEENTYKGADILTESMKRLGLVNTFMAVPYDAVAPAYRQTTYLTPANSKLEVGEDIDPSRQSTAEDIGTLLSMIYYCSKGGGTLLAVYPDELTPDECQAIIDLMVLNEEGNLIRYGVPEGIPVSHKHGWIGDTHADAGIVFSPGGDFVIVEYLHRSGAWLVADESFPILREIARATYNYFNIDNPYLGDPLKDREVVNPADPFSENQAGGTDTAAPGEGASQEGSSPTAVPGGESGTS